MPKVSTRAKVVRLFRGITVPVDQSDAVTEQIVQRGLSGEEGTWRFGVPNVKNTRKKIDDLFQDPKFERDHLFKESPHLGVCACGESLGAVHYADRHNRSTNDNHAIVVEFSVPINRIYVDCRDFLCTTFQLWDRASTQGVESQRKYLADLFGPAVIRYFDRCVEDTDQNVRIAMCNLASFDEKVVRHHYANRHLIAGRYGTLFRSAFFVQGPVLATEIDACRSPTADEVTAVQAQNADNAYVSLDKFFSHVAD